MSKINSWVLLGDNRLLEVSSICIHVKERIYFVAAIMYNMTLVETYGKIRGFHEALFGKHWSTLYAKVMLLTT